MRLLKDIRKYFKYNIQACRTELKAEVAGSKLNWFWWLAQPLCNMIVYTVVFGYILQIQEEYYALFVFIGVTIWTFFNKMVSLSVKLIKSNKSIISKVYIPKPILLLTEMFNNFFKLILTFSIIIIMMFFYKITISIYILNCLYLLVLLFVYTYALCMFIMHFGVYVEDLSYVVPIVMNMLVYLTGVFYSVTNRFPSPLKEIVLCGNPIALIIEEARNALIYKQAGMSVWIYIWSVVSIILLIIGNRLVYKNENNYVKVI